MRSVTTLGIGVLLAVLAAPVQAEIFVNDFTEIDQMAYVPCANGGAGELVELSGTLHTLVAVTLNGNSLLGKVQFHPQGVSGVGLSTGDVYRATGMSQTLFRSSLPAGGQYTETFVNNYRIIGRGTGNNQLVHDVVHLTINANDEVTVFHELVMGACR